MPKIDSVKVKEILEEVGKAYDILEDELSGDLDWIKRRIDEAKQILYDIPHPDDISQLYDEDEENG